MLTTFAAGMPVSASENSGCNGITRGGLSSASSFGLLEGDYAVKGYVLRPETYGITSTRGCRKEKL